MDKACQVIIGMIKHFGMIGNTLACIANWHDLIQPKKLRAVLAVTKAAKDVLCTLHYQQDGACMALIATINIRSYNYIYYNIWVWRE